MIEIRLFLGKRLITLILCLVIMFLLVGCGAKTTGNDVSHIATGEINNAKNIREDVCELYLNVLEDLWNVDPGLNNEITQIGIDLSEFSDLSEAEKEYVTSEFASKHNLPYIVGTWEELCEQGCIDKENLIWEEGLFISIKTNEDNSSFDAYKWRSGLGAYFFRQCSAQKNADGTWSYTVGQEMIS